jgi:hypothetical protein
MNQFGASLRALRSSVSNAFFTLEGTGNHPMSISALVTYKPITDY